MAIIAPMLALPDAEVAEAMVEKYRGLGRYFGELAERQREGVAHGRVPAAFAVEMTVEQIDGVLATPVADDPAARDRSAAVRDGRRRVEGSAARRRRDRRTTWVGDVPRRAA